MFLPVRCFSCGKVLAPYYEKYLELLEEGKTPGEALDELGIKRYCCRRTIMAHVELHQELLPYGENINRREALKKLVKQYYGKEGEDKGK